MSLAAMLWALTEAATDNPTDALYLVAMADYANGDGQGCYASQTTLAAHARISRRTSQRVQERLAEQGLIVPGDDQLVAHYRADRRPLVWDLAMPRRGVTLTPRGEDGASSELARGVSSDTHGASPVAHNPRPNPSRPEGGVAARRETADGAADGCAAHRGRRRPACADCQRVVPLHRDQVKPANPASIKAARAALRRTP